MENKITQKQYYNAILDTLNGHDTEISVEKMVEFIQGRIALLDKKTASRKPTKTQEANEGLKQTIVTILTDLGTPVTASEVLADPRIEAGTSLPKITSMLTALVKAKEIIRTEDKKKAYFSVPTAEDTEEVDAE